MMKAAVTGGNQAAVDSLKSEAKTYMLHPAEWYRFNDRILIYKHVGINGKRLFGAKMSLVPVLH
jgi:hypothetical protein